MGNPYLGLQRIKILFNGYQVQDDVKDFIEEKGEEESGSGEVN
jgi:hypothetical protein